MTSSAAGEPNGEAKDADKTNEDGEADAGDEK